MLIGKGPKQTSEDLVDLLLECHQRIRSFSALALAVSGQSDFQSNETVDACKRVQKYFSEALPLHVKDEEESILPRLVGRSREVDDALAQMQAQHRTHETPLRQLLELCGNLRALPEETSDARAELRDLANSLQSEFARHLDLEEAIIFPAVRVHLLTDEQAAIVHELRARRKVPRLTQ